MGPLRIVLYQPGIHRSAHLRQITERVGIEHFSPECALKPFNVRILNGPPLRWASPAQSSAKQSPYPRTNPAMSG